MPRDDDKLSTTALARKLDIPVQQLFAVLKDYGWIQRPSDSWVLTPKGEFEGGTYHSSRRYGSYIVWPDTLATHPLLQAIESNQRITAASMCSYYKPLHARHINRALAELGMQQHSALGWELTRLGKSLGGVQEESGSSGAFYVTWPHEIVDNPVVHRELTLQSGQVYLNDTSIEQFTPLELAQRRAVLTQSYELAFPFSVTEVVEMASYCHQEQCSKQQLANYASKAIDRQSFQ